MKTPLLELHYFGTAGLRNLMRTHFTPEERLEDLIEYQEKLVKYHLHAVTVTRKKGGDVVQAWRRHEVAFERLRKLRRYLVKIQFEKKIKEWERSYQPA